jgi:flagellar motility protein MotE (MotC chaperone)
MLRLIAVLTGVLSSAILLAEIVGIGILWAKGTLTAQNAYEIRLILTGEANDEGERELGEDKETGVSQKEIQTARIMRVLDLESREKELESLKKMTESIANELISSRKTFDEMKQAFRNELEELEERQRTAAVEQARAVLLASPVESAVERLMALPLDEAIAILAGMPEKSIAKILQGFDVPGPANTIADGATESRKVRGQKIFEALSRGEPLRNVIRKTLDQKTEGAAAAPRGKG